MNQKRQRTGLFPLRNFPSISSCKQNSSTRDRAEPPLYQVIHEIGLFFTALARRYQRHRWPFASSYFFQLKIS